MSSSKPEKLDFALAKYSYGKNFVKLLHVKKDGTKHTIKEYEVDTRLRLRTQKDYLVGDNEDIIATDTQKNTVYLLARRHGVESPEEFALLLVNHFLYTYSHVEEATVRVEEYPWERLNVDHQPHEHAFVFTPSALRVCTVSQTRNEKPQVTGGLRGLRLLKTTQSAFKDFVKDAYRTLPDMDDRVFSTVVTADWDYSSARGIDYDKVWGIVKDCIVEKFAGPATGGVFSPSVQNTLYLAEKMVLEKVHQIKRIEMEMPNKHYFGLDLSKFPASVVGNDPNREVYQPVDKPSGIIHAVLERNKATSKL